MKTNYPIQATFWDIDGVFVDTEELHLEAWQYLASTFGKSFTREDFLPFVAKGGKEFAEQIHAKIGISGSYEELRKIRREHFSKLRQRGIPVIHENVALARNFAKAFPEVRRAAVSSSPRSDIEDSLKLAGLDDFFEMKISFEDKVGLKRKPAPDMYFFALERMALSADNVLVFEDTPSGISAAKAAGIRYVVALPNNLTNGLDLSQADLIIRLGERKDPHLIIETLTK